MSRFWFLSRFCLKAEEGRKISIFRSARAKFIALKKIPQWIWLKCFDHEFWFYLSFQVYVPGLFWNEFWKIATLLKFDGPFIDCPLILRSQENKTYRHELSRWILSIKYYMILRIFECQWSGFIAEIGLKTAHFESHQKNFLTKSIMST